MLNEAAATDLLRDHVGLWDWRRRIAELCEIRAFDDPELAWWLWRDRRDELFAAIRSRRPRRAAAQLRRPGAVRLRSRPSVRGRAGADSQIETHDLSGGRDGYVQLIPCAHRGAWWPPGGELNVIGLAAMAVACSCRFAMLYQRTTFGGGRYLLDGIKGPTLAWMAAAGRSSTSTSPTTRPAPVRRAGSARSRRLRTSCSSRSPQASAYPPDLGPAWRSRVRSGTGP